MQNKSQWLTGFPQSSQGFLEIPERINLEWFVKTQAIEICRPFHIPRCGRRQASTVFWSSVHLEPGSDPGK